MKLQDRALTSPDFAVVFEQRRQGGQILAQQQAMQDKLADVADTAREALRAAEQASAARLWHRPRVAHIVDGVRRPKPRKKGTHRNTDSSLRIKLAPHAAGLVGSKEITLGQLVAFNRIVMRLSAPSIGAARI